MNVCVVGANRGIGLEFCRQFKDKGYNVTAVCRSPSSDVEAIADTSYFDVDVTQEQALQTVAKNFQPHTFDIFIHVAGIMRSTSFASFAENDILDQLRVNSLAPLLSIRAFATTLKNEAKVAVLTSRMGSIADNDSGGSYGYRMSKAALNAAVKSMSIDHQDKSWSVIALHPGWVKTDMTGHTGQLDVTESVRGMIKLLAEPGQKYNGRFVHTNGEELPW